MPYIKQDERTPFFKSLENLPEFNSAGHLNYYLTKVVHKYLDDRRGENYSANYQAMNDVMGALEGCKLELYRQKIAPYEDIKIAENGNV